MTTEAPVAHRPALLVMDLHVQLLEMLGGLPDLLGRVEVAIAEARRAGIPIIYVGLGFRSGYPEVDSRNSMFQGVAASGMFSAGAPGTAFHPRVRVEPGDVTVTKLRVSAFTGSGLDVVLRSQRIDEVVLMGVETSGVVLSTLRQAADLDWRVVVLADGCADSDPEVHRVLLQKVFPRQAEVLGVDEWIARVGASPPEARATPSSGPTGV